MAIGRDLLDVPFAELVRNLAVAIADGQAAMDRNSLATLQALVGTTVDVITDITETLEPDIQELPVTVRDANGVPTTGTVTVTGAKIRSTPATPVPMNLLQAGLFPTFYQFTEATIEVHISITVREDNSANAQASTSPLFGLGPSQAFASTVDYRTQNTYTYESTGSSVLTATLKPVPPPSRAQPTIHTVNLFSNPPTVTTV